MIPVFFLAYVSNGLEKNHQLEDHLDGANRDEQIPSKEIYIYIIYNKSYQTGKGEDHPLKGAFAGKGICDPSLKLRKHSL